VLIAEVDNCPQFVDFDAGLLGVSSPFIRAKTGFDPPPSDFHKEQIMTPDRERVVKVQRDMEWHEAIAQYLPQVRTMTSGDPTAIIKWLFERVSVSEGATAVAAALRDSEVQSAIERRFGAGVRLG
jgi:hypothetical protein